MLVLARMKQPRIQYTFKQVTHTNVTITVKLTHHKYACAFAILLAHINLARLHIRVESILFLCLGHTFSCGMFDKSQSIFWYEILLFMRRREAL